jgi:amino acid transporter/mannitol/fructose-specific phosphotransferase system IIA component (Ntr-type)
MPAAPSSGLKKNLTLFDVYAICTGAMFSSGFFLLPGLATAKAGPATVLAYLLAGIMILPAMFSMAELSTAMPKAGGAYYFLDRSLGPLAGTIGGLGTWLALIFKSAFALIGMGAYLVLFVELPIKPVAVALTIAFTTLNIVGAKETSGLQRVLVTTLVSVLAYFLVEGLVEVIGHGMETVARDQFTPFAPFGIDGIVATIGLVFVSYAGLTKVASVAEEVQNPDRNVPLGMMLSLATATFIYVVGVYIMIAVLDAETLRSDLTPVATAGEAFFDWLPEPYGVLLIVVAAIAAFASTANAGILSGSRYPLAMARDELVSRKFATIGRFNTPTTAILSTGGIVIFFILVLDPEGVAKLASAFQLLIFTLVNLAVIVMRESKVPSYLPGYRSPWYPWMQIAGIVVAMILIAEMGLLSVLFTAGIVLSGIAWYAYYVHPNPQVEREGAIYHLFARLGAYRYEGLDSELRSILKERGVDDEAAFERLVAQAAVVDLEQEMAYEDVVTRASAQLATRLPVTAHHLEQGFLEGSRYGATPVAQGAALPHQQLPGLREAALVLVRCRDGLCIQFEGPEEAPSDPVYALFFLISPEDQPGDHLRTLASIASRLDEESFMAEWRGAETEQQLKETLLHHDRYLSLYLRSGEATADFIGQPLRELDLPANTLIALVHRGGTVTIPRGSTVLREGDRITVIGEATGIRQLYDTYRGETAEA